MRLLLLLFVLHVCASMAIAGSFLDIEMSRITIPIAKDAHSNVTVAASFNYATYVRGENKESIPTSKEFAMAIENVPEEARWQYPEYAAIQYFEGLRQGDFEQVLESLAPGEIRKTWKEKNLKDAQGLEQSRITLQRLSEMYLLDKAYYGRFALVGLVHKEPNDANENTPGQGMPMHGFMLENHGAYRCIAQASIGSVFGEIVMFYSVSTINQREEIDTSIDTRDMQCFGVKVRDDSQKVSGHEIVVPLPDCEPDRTEFMLYVKAHNIDEPVVEPIVSFVTKAANAYNTGTKEEILEYWTLKSRDSVQRDIELLENYDAWPETRRSPFSRNIEFVAVLPVETGFLVYYRSQGSESGRVIGVVEENDVYEICWARDMPDLAMSSILSRQVFIRGMIATYTN